MSVLDQSLTIDNTSSTPPIERTEEMVKLLLIYFLDRTAYYGLRAILVIFLVEAYNGDSSTPLYIYGLFTGCVYVVSYVGGFLGDFVFGTKNALFIGLLTSGIGAILLGLFGSHFVYFTLFIVALGNGLTRPNILAQTAKSFYETKKGLGKIFISSYMMINLGALIGVLITSQLYVIIGFMFTMFIVGFLGITAAIIVLTGQFNEPSKTPYKNHRFKQRSGMNILRLLIPIIGVSLFWFIFEVGYIDFLFPIFDNINTSLANVFGQVGYQLSNVVPLTIFSILLLIFYKKINFSYTRIIAIGLLLSSLTWIVIILLNYIMSDTLNIVGCSFIVIIFALVEILISPFMLALIAWKAPNQLMGTTFSMYLLISFLLTKLTTYITSNESLTTVTIYIALVILTGIGVLTLFMHLFFPKEDSTLESNDPI